jgi:uncharacterized protein YkwD
LNFAKYVGLRGFILLAFIAALTLTSCAVVQTGSLTSAPPTSSTAPSPSFPSGPPYTANAAPFKPAAAQADLFQYTLDLINQDRSAKGLTPVTLGYNAAAQVHAQDMFDNYFLSHWGTDGLKPYMRYTLEGGLNYEAENSAYGGPTQKMANPGSLYARIDPKAEIQSLEYSMLNEDASSNWGHRDNILNKLHKKVNLGIAYDLYHLTLVQQFEGDYLEWVQPPTISGNLFSAAGRITQQGIDLNNVSLCFDPSPQPQTADQLLNGPHSYSMGKSLNFLVSPPPPGMYYSQLDPLAIQANTWQVDKVSGQFSIQADISRTLANGSGVYTVVFVVNIDGQAKGLCNYSVFIK